MKARRLRPPLAYTVVPRAWPGETAVCIGGGPSLTREDVEYCRGRARVIAINDAYRLAPWADVLYAADQKWWAWHQGVRSFEGEKYTVDVATAKRFGVQLLAKTGYHGLETENRSGLKLGQDSGYQAIGLAVHLGASRILLLGYDMRGGHWFGSHPDNTRPPFTACKIAYATLPAALAVVGVEVVNCSRQTTLDMFPRMALADALTETREAVA